MYQLMANCYANTLNSKERSIKLLTVSHQRIPKSGFKCSLGQKSNVATVLRGYVPQSSVADYEHVRT